MNTLKLTIKKEYFDMILSGKKTEEYREIKKHWAVRLITYLREFDYLSFDEMLTDLKNPLERHHSLYDLEKYWQIERSVFDQVEFTNGYRATSPKATFECIGVIIRTGNPDWGAEPDKNYFVIRLGKEISRTNCKK